MTPPLKRQKKASRKDMATIPRTMVHTMILAKYLRKVMNAKPRMSASSAPHSSMTCCVFPTSANMRPIAAPAEFSLSNSTLGCAGPSFTTVACLTLQRSLSRFHRSVWQRARHSSSLKPLHCCPGAELLPSSCGLSHRPTYPRLKTHASVPCTAFCGRHR